MKVGSKMMTAKVAVDANNDETIATTSELYSAADNKSKKSYDGTKHRFGGC